MPHEMQRQIAPKVFVNFALLVVLLIICWSPSARSRFGRQGGGPFLFNGRGRVVAIFDDERRAQQGHAYCDHRNQSAPLEPIAAALQPLYFYSVRVDLRLDRTHGSAP